MERPLGTPRRWALAILWNLAVLSASFDGLSAAHTGSIVVAVLHFIAPSLDAGTVGAIHFGIRKLAHLTEYAILSALYLYAQRPAGKGIPTLLRWSLIAVGICAATAILDEWHQSFVPSRTGSPVDVAIDILGAAIAQLLAAALRARAHRRALES